LNPPIRIEEDSARLHGPVQQPEAVRKPKRKRNPYNPFRLRGRRPPRGRVQKGPRESRRPRAIAQSSVPTARAIRLGHGISPIFNFNLAALD
jgi:hypothetical protein